MNGCTRTAHSNTVCTVCIYITYLNMYKSFVKYFCKDERRRLEEEVSNNHALWSSLSQNPGCHDPENPECPMGEMGGNGWNKF